MQIRIGEKIRELRHRDERKQEDLATAVGVTSQAVSRWESCTGYPDTEIIPAIANYFHVSIDELFGYHGDREDKIKSIADKADELLYAQGDMTECVDMLRAASDEFPNEPKILLRLGYALQMFGWQKFGARGYTKDGSDYTYEDTEYNSKNIYWQESMQVFEKVLGMDIPNDDREAIVSIMVMIYGNMGMWDKAEKIAEKQGSVSVSRECLLPYAKTEEERERCFGEAIIALLSQLKSVMVRATLTKLSYSWSNKSKDPLLALIKLYESIFSDENRGYMFMEICELYLHCAIHAGRAGDNGTAMEFFDAAFENKQQCEAASSDIKYFTAPLIEKVSYSNSSADYLKVFWGERIDMLPDALLDEIRKNEKYAECFE